MDTQTQAVMFSSKSDEWTTPLTLWEQLNDEFSFGVDLAARSSNRLCPVYCGPDHVNPSMRDALEVDWITQFKLLGIGWCNPPYSMCKEFLQKAWNEHTCGFPSVFLLPARTDTKWFHEFVWDCHRNRTYEGVEMRFVKGRLKFGDQTNSAPFPSLIVIYRGVKSL